VTGISGYDPFSPTDDLRSIKNGETRRKAEKNFRLKSLKCAKFTNVKDFEELPHNFDSHQDDV
jgi:hypothetical protein